MSQPKTEDIHHLLDLLSSSMDWGSGFLEDDDIACWARVSDATNYPFIVTKGDNRYGGYPRLVKREEN